MISFLKCLLIKTIIVITHTMLIMQNFNTLSIIIIPENFPIIPGYSENLPDIFRNIPDSFPHLLCLKLCWHNRLMPKFNSSIIVNCASKNSFNHEFSNNEPTIWYRYIYGSISLRGSTDIVMFTGIMNTEHLCAVFEVCLVPFLWSHYPDGHTYPLAE